jgi:hypothetical protein
MNLLSDEIEIAATPRAPFGREFLVIFSPVLAFQEKIEGTGPLWPVTATSLSIDIAMHVISSLCPFSWFTFCLLSSAVS